MKPVFSHNAVVESTMCDLCRAIEKCLSSQEELYNKKSTWCNIADLWAISEIDWRSGKGSCTKSLFNTRLQERVEFAIELY